MCVSTRQKLTSRQSFEPSAMLWRNTIPRFCRTIVQVVDAIQIHIFGVESKHCFPHAKVQVGGVHAFYSYVADTVKNGSKVADVPNVLI